MTNLEFLSLDFQRDLFFIPRWDFDDGRVDDLANFTIFDKERGFAAGTWRRRPRWRIDKQLEESHTKETPRKSERVRAVMEPPRDESQPKREIGDQARPTPCPYHMLTQGGCPLRRVVVSGREHRRWF